MAIAGPSQAKRPQVSPKTPNAAKRRRAKLRKTIWPEVTDEMVWSRETFKGFTSVPRTMPIIIRIIDSLSKQNAGNVYLGIWCKSFDDYVLEVKDEFDLAFSAGYDGQRAVRSWRERVSVLEQLGFLKVLKAPHGGYRYILVLDPHKVVEELYKKDRIHKDLMSSLQITMINIGARKDED